jgi:pimeloyl-ACP methyl ester carboxylesterase
MATATSADGTTIAYETAGDGPAVILVDGALCFRNAGPMRPIAEALAPHFTVYLYDRRGRGASGDETPAGATATETVACEIEDLDALVSVAGGPVAAFGISSGAALVLRAAEGLGPERVSRVVLFEPPYMPDGALPAAAEYTAALGDALTAGRRDDALSLFFRRVGMPEDGVEGMKHSAGWPASMALAHTLAYDDAALGDSSIPRNIAGRVSVPVLALAGGASPAFLRYGAEGVAEAAPRGRFQVLGNQSHDIDAAAVAPALAGFFRLDD